MTLYPSTGCFMTTTRVRVLRARTSYLQTGEGGGMRAINYGAGGPFAYVLFSLYAYGDGRAGWEGENDQFSNVYMVQRENRIPGGGGLF